MPGRRDIDGERRVRLAGHLAYVRHRTDRSVACGQSECLDAIHLRGHVKSILDPSFRYTASFNTDLDKTFARVRRHQRQQEKKAVEATEEAFAKVASIVRKPIRG
jgi:hypothetical protein